MPAFSRFAAASSSSLQQAERAASGLDALCTEASPAPAKQFCQSRTPSADSSRSRTAFLRFAAASSTSVAAVLLGSRCFCGCRRACCLGLILGFRCSFVDICRCSVVGIAVSLWMPKGAVSLRGYDAWGQFFSFFQCSFVRIWRRFQQHCRDTDKIATMSGESACCLGLAWFRVSWEILLPYLGPMVSSLASVAELLDVVGKRMLA